MQRRTISADRLGRLPAVPVLLTILSLLLVATPAAAANDKYAAIVVDANTGKTLYEDSADEKRYPASLTKMMTLYVLFEELAAKRFTLASQFSVSANAAAQAPSKLGLRAGSTIKVEDAILALTTKSANDASVVVAENVSGSVSQFAERMTRTARSLGMTRSTFRNPNGLPNPSQFTSARDMAKLGAALQDRFPQFYKFFSARSFTWKGKNMRNHNRLLGSVAGVDGIKTGYTRASGFNLVSTVKRDGRHIIAVVMGGKTGASRDAHMRDLIAKHLPSAKKGRGDSPLLVADGPAPVETEVAETPQPTQAPAETLEVAAVADTAVATTDADPRLPRPRPASEAEPELIAYAPTAAPRDLVAAAMAQQPVARPLVKAGAASAAAQPAPAAPAQDAVSERIAAANEVAQVAMVAGGDDRLARLTQIAQARAGVTKDIVAAPRVRTSDPEAGEAGWHIQIGAVPTMQGAEELIEKAQSSMGPVLASRRALTQEVAKDGTTLYRARFAGFVGKDDARDACTKLKSKSFSCLAVRN